MINKTIFKEDLILQLIDDGKERNSLLYFLRPQMQFYSIVYLLGVPGVAADPAFALVLHPLPGETPTKQLVVVVVVRGVEAIPPSRSPTRWLYQSSVAEYLRDIWTEDHQKEDPDIHSGNIKKSL